jgi:hypothetical protein
MACIESKISSKLYGDGAKEDIHKSPLKWVKKKYFTKPESKDRIFHVPKKQGKILTLKFASDMPIIRHMKI